VRCHDNQVAISLTGGVDDALVGVLVLKTYGIACYTSRLRCEKTVNFLGQYCDAEAVRFILGRSMMAS
jgi:hypothetical protein